MRLCDKDNKFGLVHGVLPLARYDNIRLCMGEDSPARINGRFVQPLGWTHKDMGVFAPYADYIAPQ